MHPAGKARALTVVLSIAMLVTACVIPEPSHSASTPEASGGAASSEATRASSPANGCVQSTHGSTVKPVKAADFSPVVLPPLDAAHLEDAVLADGSPQRSSDFELKYDAAPMSFLYPHETKLMRTVTVVNKGRPRGACRGEL